MSEINDSKESPGGIFPINLKLIDHYQRKEPIPMDKYNMGAYQTGSIHGESNIHLNLIMCEVKTVILLIV